MYRIISYKGHECLGLPDSKCFLHSCIYLLLAVFGKEYSWMLSLPGAHLLCCIMNMLGLDGCSGGLKVSVKVVSLNVQAGLVGKSLVHDQIMKMLSLPNYKCERDGIVLVSQISNFIVLEISRNGHSNCHIWMGLSYL